MTGAASPRNSALQARAPADGPALTPPTGETGFSASPANAMLVRLALGLAEEGLCDDRLDGAPEERRWPLSRTAGVLVLGCAAFWLFVFAALALK